MLYSHTNIGRLILESIASQEKTAGVANCSKYDPAGARKISSGLTKVASLPYREDVYRNVQEMMKIAAGCINGLCEAVDSANKRAVDFEKVAEVRALIDDMVSYGLISDDGITEKVAELVKKESRDLEIIKEAVKLTARGRDGNVFFENEKTAADQSIAKADKRGMFDDVMGAAE